VGGWVGFASVLNSNVSDSNPNQNKNTGYIGLVVEGKFLCGADT